MTISIVGLLPYAAAAYLTVIMTRGIIEYIREGTPFEEWSGHLMIACFYWALWLLIGCLFWSHLSA